MLEILGYYAWKSPGDTVTRSVAIIHIFDLDIKSYPDC